MTRARILDAALRIFIEEGFVGARTDAVAARAGVAHGTVFSHFPTKSDLFEAAITASVSEHRRRLDELAADRARPADDILAAQIAAIYDDLVLGDARDMLRLVLSEARRFPDVARRYRTESLAAFEATFARVIARGVGDGVFRPIAALQFPGQFAGPALSLALQTMLSGEDPGANAGFWQTWRDAHIDFVLTALRCA
jgi:AcrR family transcriptional regulator